MRRPTQFHLLPIILLCVTVVCLPSVVVSGEMDHGDQEVISPTILHQQLGEAKAQSQADRQFVRKLIAAEGLDDTQYNYNVLFYDVFIRVNDTTEIIYGEVGFVAVATLDGVSEVQVNLYNNMVIDSIVGPSGNLTFTRYANVVTVFLGTSYDEGDTLEFLVGYNGHPLEGGFKAFAFDEREGIKVISSLSEPYYAPTWWPCKDRMDDKADSMDIAIEIDTSFYCGSNGVLDSIVSSSANSHTFYYRERYPIVTYLFSVAISEYIVWSQQYYYNDGADSMPVVHAVFPDRIVNSEDTWGNTPHYIEVLADDFGPYPFLDEKYGHANFDWGGAMEHQTMTSMGGSAFYWSIIVHELAHQWWGDMITCESWQDIWLNEGWASYSESVFALDEWGWDYYRTYMGYMEYGGGGTVYCQDTTSVGSIFHGGLSYDKGAWVVHMLRGVLGEEAFAQGIEAYYNSEHQHAAATSEDFENVWEGATGVELGWYFEEWLHGEYRPNYEWYYATEMIPGGGCYLYLVVRQVQTTDPQVFTMPVDFLFEFESLAEDTVVCLVDARKTFFKFHYPQCVNNVVLDPAYWVLKYETNLSWEMFITTLDEDLSDGSVYLAYEDTIRAYGGSGDQTFTLTGGTLPAGLTLSSNGVVSGYPADTGTFEFDVSVVDNTEGYVDQATLGMHVGYQCCGEFTHGYTGNVNRSSDGETTLADITLLIDRVYVSKTPLECESDGNVNGSADGHMTLSDITSLIDKVFISKQPTARCR